MESLDVSAIIESTFPESLSEVKAVLVKSCGFFGMWPHGSNFWLSRDDRNASVCGRSSDDFRDHSRWSRQACGGCAAHFIVCRSFPVSLVLSKN
jgi:hypothetical protein